MYLAVPGVPAGTGCTWRYRAYLLEPGVPGGTGRTWSVLSTRYARSCEPTRARWERTYAHEGREVGPIRRFRRDAPAARRPCREGRCQLAPGLPSVSSRAGPAAAVVTGWATPHGLTSAWAVAQRETQPSPQPWAARRRTGGGPFHRFRRDAPATRRACREGRCQLAPGLPSVSWCAGPAAPAETRFRRQAAGAGTRGPSSGARLGQRSEARPATATHTTSNAPTGPVGALLVVVPISG